MTCFPCPTRIGEDSLGQVTSQRFVSSVVRSAGRTELGHTGITRLKPHLSGTQNMVIKGRLKICVGGSDAPVRAVKRRPQPT